jgi:hypothetical protein
MKVKLTYTVTLTLTRETDNCGYSKPDNLDSIVKEENSWLDDGYICVEELIQESTNIKTVITGEIL